MYITLWIVAVLCILAAGVAIGVGQLLGAIVALLIGIVFGALAEVLERLTRIATQLAVKADRITTNLGDFEKLGDVEGEATCIGCRRTVPKAGLYYHKTLDVYYHPECLTRDRSL